MNPGAVITADIVNSTKLSKADNKRLIKNLLLILQPYTHEFFRGDSFQVYVKSPVDALQVLLQLRAVAMKLQPGASIPLADIRSSIGIGLVKQPVKTLRTATDEAFVLSGRSFDKLKPDQRLVISCTEKNQVANLGLNVIAHFIDYLFQRLTSKQASVVFELLLNRTQTEIARKLKKSQATVHKHVQSAGWPEIEKLLQEYRLLIDSIKL
jgi:biotin operon repressor